MLRAPPPRRTLRLATLALGLVLSAAAHAARIECHESIPDLFERISPAVVMISGQTINPFRLQERVTSSLGSGFLIEDSGVILTNSHVVFGLQSLQVKLDDGTVLAARMIGADPIFDVATRVGRCSICAER